jgi:hypothetical protein
MAHRLTRRLLRLEEALALQAHQSAADGENWTAVECLSAITNVVLAYATPEQEGLDEWRQLHWRLFPPLASECIVSTPNPPPDGYREPVSEEEAEEILAQLRQELDQPAEPAV